MKRWKKNNFFFLEKMVERSALVWEKKWRFFFRIFWFRFSISIVVGTKDVYVIRGIVSQGSKLSKILRTTKTTTKKAVFFWKIRNKPHQNQKKKIFIPTINQQQKISHLWKKNTKKNSLPTKKKKLNATKKRNKNSFFLFAAV